MAIRYSRLVSAENRVRVNTIYRMARNKLPTQFFKQEIVLVSIVALSFILLIVSVFFTPESTFDSTTISSGLKYGVVVDCGSSGTRAHIFTWNKEYEAAKGEQSRIELLRDKSTGRALTKHIEPGLSSFSNDPDRASDYMEPIMQFISATVPANRHLDTPVHFMATAGLRLLNDSIQKKILNDITRDLRAKYDFPRIKSQVISGEFEGIYSWLSLNLDRIYDDESRDVPQDRSIGMLEMGGASIQVTFEINPELENHIINNLRNKDAIVAFRNEQITVNLNRGHSVKLFAATFLGMGVNSARDSAIDQLVRDYLKGIGELGKARSDDEMQHFEVSLIDPCLNEGSSELVIRPGEVATETTQSIGFVLSEHSKTFKVRLQGSGNFLNCFDLLNRVMRNMKSAKLHCSPGRGSCPMTLLGENFIPYQHYKFMGLSEFFFTTNEMMNAAGPFNNSKILHEANRICSTNHQRLQEDYVKTGVVKHQDRVLYECFKAAWLLNVLHNDGFNMPSQYDKFNTIEQLNGREIDWTIGAVIFELLLNNRTSESL